MQDDDQTTDTDGVRQTQGTEDRVSDATPEDDISDATPDDQTDDTAGKDALLTDLAKARRQRNAARAELEQATSLLATARAQLVDAAITREGYKPAGVKAGGLDTDALFDENGTFDPVAAKHAVTEIARTHGLASTKPAAIDRGRDRTPPDSGGWQAALTGK